jgi:hypothetical protein
MFLLLIAEALIRISIFMLKDFGGSTNVFAVDCGGISQNFIFMVKDSGEKSNVFAVDCRGISQKSPFL